MHTSVAWWDDERIRWYERASSYSHFHSFLAEDIEKLLRKGQRIIEEGCGLGYIAEILANDGYDIKAMDIDSKAIRRAAERSRLDIFSVSDFNDPIPASDVLLMVYFGRIAETDCVERLLEAAPEIIYVLSHHKGQDTDRREKKGNIEVTMDYLERKGIHYERQIVTYDFSQPLLSMDDARDYIARMYGAQNIESYIPFLEAGTGYPYVLRNMKTSSIFMIRR